MTAAEKTGYGSAMATKSPKSTKSVFKHAVRTSLITGAPHTFKAVVEQDRHTTVARVEFKGKVYHLTPKNYWDSIFSADETDSWRQVGEPYESRRAYAQKQRAATGKLAAWEQKALDAKLLDVIGAYSSGAGTEWLHEDLFNNHGWSWTRGDAERYSGSPDTALSGLAGKATYNKPTQRSLVQSAVKRLLKAGKLVEVWNSRAGKMYVQVA